MSRGYKRTSAANFGAREGTGGSLQRFRTAKQLMIAREESIETEEVDKLAKSLGVSYDTIQVEVGGEVMKFFGQRGIDEDTLNAAEKYAARDGARSSEKFVSNFLNAMDEAERSGKLNFDIDSDIYKEAREEFGSLSRDERYIEPFKVGSTYAGEFRFQGEAYELFANWQAEVVGTEDGVDIDSNIRGFTIRRK